ncbi:Arginine--tRNA ligase, partial [candidate division TM7 genomosp. GTL1]
PANPRFGADFAIPCFSYAAQKKHSPAEIAKELAAGLRHSAIEKTEAVSGFVNIRLKSPVLTEAALSAPEFTPESYKDKVVVAEYSDPNPFKVLHAGHLYTTIVGDSIAALVEAAGARVHRINYGGDVGLHVGRAMWSIIRHLGGEYPEKLREVSTHERASWVSRRYVEGTTAYETNDKAKAEIVEINKRVYKLHEDNDHESSFAEVYWTCRQWSYDGFDAMYDRLQITPFEAYWPESKVTPKGIEIVQQGLKDAIFEESNGATIFKAEEYGLHTRVFLNSDGIPTYEAKDLGLAALKWQTFHFDKSIIITANDIVDYMKVVLKALEHFYPEVAERSTHLTHGLIKLPGGKKMSSRKGNTLLAADILEAAAEAATNSTIDESHGTVLAAVKYAFLKQRIGGDIVYEPEESVSLEGNSGPYIQYAHARACGILRKAQKSIEVSITTLDETERELARKIGQYPTVLTETVDTLRPHHICTYLYELAQAFNRFYEKSRIVGSEREAERLMLVRAYAGVLKNGLAVLRITAPERM